jgi:hypothetical protein
MLTNCLANVYAELVTISIDVRPWDNPELAVAAREIMDRLETKGYNPFEGNGNPNVGYSLARFRTTTRPSDRVYAIMQTHGFVLGKSRDPAWNGSLEDLMDELAINLVQSSPVLFQLFIHIVAPRPGKSWRITQEISVPGGFTSVRNLGTQCSTNVTGSGTLALQGLSCALRDLTEAYSGRTVLTSRDHLQGECWLQLDCMEHLVNHTGTLNLRLGCNVLPLPIYCAWWSQPICKALLGRFDGSRLRVFRTAVQKNRAGSEASIRVCFGIVVFHDRWVRIGVCRWTEYADGSLETSCITPADGFRLP